MKKNLIILSLILMCHSLLTAQFEIKLSSFKDSKKEKTTTYFVYRDSDKEDLENLKKIVKNSWNYNKIELIDHNKFNMNDLKEEDMAFCINYTYNSYRMGTISDPGSGAAVNTVDFYLTLIQKTPKEAEIIATSQLTVNGKTIADVCRTTKEPAEIIKNQYTTYDILNWNYAYIATYLKTVSDKLSDKQDYSTIKSTGGDLSVLKSGSLYISDQVNREFSTFNGKEKLEDKKEDIDKYFNYSFEMVTTNQINEKIVSGEDGYLLQFNKKGNGSFVIIIDMKSKEIIYCAEHLIKYNFDASMMKEINVLISGKKK